MTTLANIAKPSRARRVIVRVALGAGCLVGAVGVLHAPFARGLLRYLPGASACPVGFAKLTPEQAEASRQAALRALGATATAATKPALGFDLGSATRADVSAWATRAGVSCRDELAGARLACDAVPAQALGESAAADRVYFGFSPAGTLVSVDAARRSLSPDAAAHFVDERRAAIARDAGEPSFEVGERSGAYLAKGAIREASVEFRFVGYRAEVSATQMNALGLLVREHYEWFDSGA